jgi:hypothetical protein
MCDLHEAGVVDLDKMDGSGMVNLYERLVNRPGTPMAKLKITTDMEKLRDAYQYGLITSRQEYLDLVKQSFEQHGLEG